MKALKLAVAESSAILRCGIIALLHRMPAANVDILEIGDISQLAAQLSRHRPDVQHLPAKHSVFVKGEG